MPDSAPTLYSFRRCPYAMRARLALAVSGQKVNLREVELKNRPQELYADSLKATVPVLVLASGEVLEESLEIMHWTLGNADPDSWLGSSESQRGAMAQLIDNCDGEFKHHLDRYKYANRYEDVDATEHREQASTFLRQLQSRIASQPFLFGEAPCLADMAVAPFVRQFAFADRTWFDAQPWKELIAWLDAFTASALFLSIMQKHEPWTPGADPLCITWE